MFNNETEKPSLRFDFKSRVEALSPEERTGIIKLFRLEGLIREALSDNRFAGYKRFFRLTLFRSDEESDEILYSGEYGWVYGGREVNLIPVTYQEICAILQKYNRTVNWAVGNYFIDSFAHMTEELVPLQQRAMSILNVNNNGPELLSIEDILKNNFSAVAKAWLWRAELEARQAWPTYGIYLKKAVSYSYLGGVELDAERMRQLPETFSLARFEKNRQVALEMISQVDKIGEKLMKGNQSEAMGELDRIIYFAEQAKLSLEFAAPYARQLIPFTLQMAEREVKKEAKNRKNLFWSWIGSAQKYANIAGVDIGQNIDILNEKLRILKKRAERPFFTRWL